MVLQIASFTTSIQYDLTINERGQATGCKCNDHYYRKHDCKHMKSFNVAFEAEVERAARFLALKSMVQGMEETARCYREMQYDPRFQ
jgi:hypothetical protein